MTPHVSIKLLLTQSDDRLVRMAAAGHDRAFEAIVDRYRRQLLRYAERFPAAGPAEDVVQAAFVRAWGALRDGTEVRDLRPWLYRIVHNTALNAAKRQRGVDMELVESEALGVGPEEESQIQEDLRRTLDGIAALPGRQRDALVAVAVDGRAHADVGRELGITEPAVRQLVRRARASVRAVASALTPYPLIAWISELGTQTASVARIGEMVGGAGTGAIVVKLGAVAATGAIVVSGAPAVKHAVHHATPTATTASARAHAASASTVAAATATPVANRTSGDAPATAPARHDGQGGHHRSASSDHGDHGDHGDHSFRSTDGVPPGPSGSLGKGRHGHHRDASADTGDDTGDTPAVAPEHGITPTGDSPRTRRHRHSGDGEHLSPADSATTAEASDEQHTRDGGETSGRDRRAGSDGSRADGSGEAEGPQAPEPHETHDGATGSSGSH